MRRCMIDVFSFPNIHMSFEFLSLLWKSKSQNFPKILTLSQEFLFHNTIGIFTSVELKQKKSACGFWIIFQKNNKWQKWWQKLLTLLNLGESGWSRISPFKPSRAILFFTAYNYWVSIRRTLSSEKRKIRKKKYRTDFVQGGQENECLKKVFLRACTTRIGQIYLPFLCIYIPWSE
jgi:hypothetical protein